MKITWIIYSCLLSIIWLKTKCKCGVMQTLLMFFNLFAECLFTDGLEMLPGCLTAIRSDKYILFRHVNYYFWFVNWCLVKNFSLLYIKITKWTTRLIRRSNENISKRHDCRMDIINYLFYRILFDGLTFIAAKPAHCNLNIILFIRLSVPSRYVTTNYNL